MPSGTPVHPGPRASIPLPGRTPWALVFALGVAVAILGGCGTTSEVPSRGATGAAKGTQAPATTWSREADRWVGIPYRLGGGDRSGVDCSGLVQQLVLRVAGVRLPRTTGELFRAGRPVGRRDLRPGDLVFFDTTGRGVSHVGLVVGGDRFVHASTSRGVMYSRLSEDYWNRRCLGVRRVL